MVGTVHISCWIMRAFSSPLVYIGFILGGDSSQHYLCQIHGGTWTPFAVFSFLSGVDASCLYTNRAWWQWRGQKVETNCCIQNHSLAESHHGCRGGKVFFRNVEILILVDLCTRCYMSGSNKQASHYLHSCTLHDIIIVPQQLHQHVGCCRVEWTRKHGTLDSNVRTTIAPKQQQQHTNGTHE